MKPLPNTAALQQLQHELDEPEPEVRCLVLQTHGRGPGLPDAVPGEELLVEGKAARRRERLGYLQILDRAPVKSRFVTVRAIVDVRLTPPGSVRPLPLLEAGKTAELPRWQAEEFAAKGQVRILGDA